MSTYLLDASVVIALQVEDHEFNERCSRWARDAARLALCPVVEGALVRTLIRTGQSHGSARGLLRAMYRSGRYEFWPDATSYADVDLAGVYGHRQVTDAYLISLVRAHTESKLATLDQALARLYPDDARLIESNSGA
jgi:predicted nucleic acid-binding protein